MRALVLALVLAGCGADAGCAIGTIFGNEANRASKETTPIVTLYTVDTVSKPRTHLPNPPFATTKIGPPPL